MGAGRGSSGCCSIRGGGTARPSVRPSSSSVDDSRSFQPPLCSSSLFLLSAPGPSFLPVLMWQAWEMKTRFLRQAERGPSSLCLLANVDRKGKKKKTPL